MPLNLDTAFVGLRLQCPFQSTLLMQQFLGHSVVSYLLKTLGKAFEILLVNKRQTFPARKSKQEEEISLLMV